MTPQKLSNILISQKPNAASGGSSGWCYASQFLKGFLVLAVFCLGVCGVMGQTTYDWLNTAPDGNFKQGAFGARWNPGGLFDEPPFGIVQFNNNNQTTMTNNVAGTWSQHKFNFGSSATTGRTIGGNTIQFFDNSGTWPFIQNQSSATHNINFPILVGTSGTFNLELVANAGNLVFGGTLGNQGKNVLVYGNNSAVDGTNRFVRLGGITSGAGKLIVSQFGVAKLNAAHTYSGNTEIDNGELWIETGGSATGSAIFVGNGGQLTNVAKIWLSNSSGGTTFTNAITINNGNANTRYLGGLNTSGTHTFSGAITNNSTTGGLNLSALTSGGITAFSGVISGSSALITEGAGQVTLSGTSANTFTGTTTANGTLLVLNKTAGLAALPSATTISTGATLRTDAANQWGTGTVPLITTNGNGILNINGNNQKVALASASSTASVTLGSGTLNIDNTGTDTYAGAISGTGALSKTNTGIEILQNSANSFTGTTTITGGEIRLQPSSNATYASQIVLNGGTLGTTGITATRTWTSSSTLNLTANSTIALLAATAHTISFANSSAVSWTAGTTLTITGWSGTYNGTAGTGGRIFIGAAANTLTPIQLSQIVFNNGTNNFSAVLLGTGELVASSNIIIPWTSAAGATAWYTAGNWTPSTASGAWMTSNIAQFNNAGTASSAGINMGTASLSIGAIDVTSARVTNNLTVNTTTATNGTLTLSGAFIQGISNTILSNNSSRSLQIQDASANIGLVLGNATNNIINISGTGGITINSIISGAGRNITKEGTGSGILTVSAANTYGGTTTINNGNLTCGIAAALPATTDVTLANTSGAGLSLGTFNQSINSLAGGGTSGGNVNLGTATLSITGASSTTFSGQFSATAGGLTLNNSSAVLTLASAGNAHTGTTIITAGELRLNPASNATYASQIQLNGGKLSTTGITANRTWTSSSTLNLTANSSIDLASATAHTISFAASNGVAWTGSTTLTINNWTGTALTGPGTGGRIFVGNANTHLSVGQLAQITFTGYNPGATILATGEVVPTSAPVSYTWTGGAANGLWSSSGNWSPSGVPGSTDQVTIVTAGTNLNLTDSRTVTNVVFNGNFNVQSTGSLTVTGNVTYTSGTGTWDCASTFTMSSSSGLSIPAYNYGNLVVSGGARTLVNGSTTRVCGNYIPGTSTTTTGSTFEFNGTTAQAINTNAASFATLNITNTAATVTANVNVTVATAMSISAGASALYNQASGTLTLTGATAIINGTLRNSGSNNIAGGTITFSSTGTYDHNRNGGTIPTATWNAASTCIITGMTSTAPTGFAQTFGKFTWNCSGQTTFCPVNVNSFVTAGTFSVLNTNSRNLSLSNATASFYTFNFASIDVSGSTSILVLSYNSVSNAGALVNVSGDVTVRNGGTFDFGAGTQPSTRGIYSSILNIGGNLSIDNASVNAASAANTSADFYVSGTWYGLVVFIRNGAQTYNNPNSVTNNGFNNIGIDYIVSPVSTVTLNSDMGLYSLNSSVYDALSVGGTLVAGTNLVNATNGSFTRFNLLGNPAAAVTVTGFAVTSGSNVISTSSSVASVSIGMSVTNANLPAGTYVADIATGSPNYIILNNAASNTGSSQSVSFSSAGNIITSNAAGLVSSGASGTVRTNTRTFNSSANYEFRGAVTGVFTTTPTAGTVNNLTINNASGVTLSSGLSVSGTLNLFNGSLDLNGLTLTMNSGNISQTISGNGSNSFTISSTTAGGVVLATGSGAHTITLSSFGTSSSGGLIIGSNTTLQMNNYAELNAGGNGTTSSMLTIDNRLLMNSGTSSFITSGTAPFYTGNATLEYGAAYDAFSEWSAGTSLSTAGTPQNVTINLSSGSVRLPANRALLGNLTITSGTFNLSSGDLSLRGDFSLTGTFTPNGKRVTFNGTTGQQTITGTPAFSLLTINNTSASNPNVVLTDDVSINTNGNLTLTAGRVVLGSYNFTMANNASLTGGSSSAFVATNGTGSFTWSYIIAGALSRTYPIGSLSPAVYSPVVLNNVVAAANGAIGLQAVAGADININTTLPATSSINRYFIPTVTVSSFTIGSMDVSYASPGEVNGTESALTVAVWDGSAGDWQNLGGSLLSAGTLRSASGVTSSNFATGYNISARTGVQLYYRTVSTGPGDWATNSTWETSPTAGFTSPSAATTPPNYLNAISTTIRSGHFVTSVGTVNTSALTIDGTLDINTGATFNLLRTSGTDLTISSTGRLNINAGANSATFETNTVAAVNGNGYFYNALSAGTRTYNGSFSFASGSTFQNAANGGKIPPATWSGGTPGSLLYITGNTSSGPGGLNQAFHNVTWEVNQGSTAVALSLGALSPAMSVGGDFIFKNTGTGELRMFSPTNGGTLTVAGKLQVQSGTMAFVNLGTATAINNNYTLNVNGLLEMTGGKLVMAGTNTTSGSGSVVLNASGGISSTNAASSLNLAAGTQAAVVNTTGDVSLTAGTIINTGTGAGTINFIKSSGSQSLSLASGALSANPLTLNIGDGVTTNTVSMLTDATLNGTGVLAVKDKAVLNSKNFRLTGGTFNLNSGGGLGVGDIYGITSSGSGATGGNIQTTNRIYNGAGNYTYNGIASQSTGNGLPGTITGALTIANTGGSGSNIVSLTTSGTTASTLNLGSGVFSIGSSNTFNVASGGTVAGTGGDFATGANGGILNFNGTGTFSGNSNPYNVYLSGVVNFGGGTVTIQNGGSMRINNGGGAITNAPFYADGSTLVYNTGATFTAGTEWYALFPTGRGVPYNVQIGLNGVNNSVLDFGTSTNWRQCNNDITIGNSTGGSGYNLILGNSGGDLKVKGNWLRNSNGSFNPNNRAVFFVGSGTTQTVAATSGSETFGYFIVDNPSGKVQLSNSPATSVTANGSIGGNVLQLSQGDLDLNGQTFNLGGSGGNLNVVGAQRKIMSATTANFNITGSKTVTSSSSGTLLFDNRVNAIISTGVDFGAGLTTINERLQIDNGGFVTGNAPKYAVGSTLVYNPGGAPYNRSIEWGQPTPLAAGYPHHVVVQNGTSLQLQNGGNPASLEIGGDLTIGNGSQNGTVDMNAAALPLKINGNLLIGNNSVNGSQLKLSSVTSADLWLYGNFTRWGTNTFNDNSRAVYLKGTGNATINTPGVTITAGVPTQSFSFLRVDKTAGTEQITLNCPVGVNNEISFTKGIVKSTATNLLVAKVGATVIGGSSTSFVDGPLAKETVTADNGVEFTFPVGKTSPSVQYQPAYLLPATASGTTTYTGEFIPGNPGAAYTGIFLGTDLSAIYKHYYWNIDKSGGGTARVAFNYSPATDSTDWVIQGGNASPSIPNNINVAVVKYYAGPYWDFTKSAGNFNITNTPPEATFYATANKIYSNVLSTFSPFTFGYSYNVILPVNLLSFTGRLVVADGKLNWKVEDAKDLAGFDMEYSIDGINYRRLATIASNGGKDYSYLHTGLQPGQHYYRLLVKDKSSKNFYSKVVTFTVGNVHTYLVGISPTVVSSTVMPVIFSAKDQVAEAYITDVSGRKITADNMQLKAGSNQWRINTQMLINGTYFISILTQDGLKETRKFVKE